MYNKSSYKENTMNLKHRLSNRTTATIRILSNTQAIYSDECTNDHKECLSIVEANDKGELWNKLYNLAITHAAQTKFAPKVNLITPDGELKIIPLKPLKVEAVGEDYKI